ncbi:hypothetical protein WP50_01980 [Lactiplantibacillus plantarum]|nr:hypothetical protein WP50_01980 [Lactiplantibacillus plantarum]
MLIARSHNITVEFFQNHCLLQRGRSDKRIVPFLNRERATAHGAIFSQHRFYREYAITDGQLITGQNPFSARAVARQLIAKL